MIVMKFGGTSLESTEALRRVGQIIAARQGEAPFVVVSAMGKTTNELLAMGADAAAGRRQAALSRAERLRAYHLREAGAAAGTEGRAALEQTLDQHFSELALTLDRIASGGPLSPQLSDELASLGERLSSQIMPLVLRQFAVDAAHIDARSVIVTEARHTRAVPFFEATNARIAQAVSRLRAGQVPVMGGFIGATEHGVTTTLGRGGSDFSAAIVGAAIGAHEIQIWTDVDGMMTCDPRLVPGALRIRTLSFSEAAELAYFGAKVLHPATLLPAMERNIPVLVLNSRRPEGAGTRIVAERVPSTSAIKCVACKKEITVVDVRSTRMLMAHGFLQQIFEIFDRYETAVDMLATSEVSVSLTIDNAERLEEICAELRPFAEVSSEADQAIVCVVGDNIRRTPGVAARVFSALGDVNVRMISQGASRLNLSFVVAGRDASTAVGLLHEEFFREADAAIFDLSENCGESDIAVKRV
jgi:aspartate kinase